MSTRIKSFFDNSIKNKLFKYLTVFSIIVICVLWLFQIVLLKPFYQANIVNNFKKSASGIETNLENEDLDLLMMQYSMDYDISLRLLSLEDASTDITSNNKSFNNYLRSLRDFDLYTLYLKAQEGKGSYSNVVEGDRMMIDNYNPNFFEGRVPEADRGNVDFIICAQILKGEDQDYLLIGYSQLTPVDPVTDTLKQQFLFVSMIFIGLSALFAVFMSKKISEPIIDINESAKTLATGNYDVKFKGEGYSEITELSNTLNYASEELKKVDGLQKELIANISHDLRTPLTMISGYAEMMRDIPEERSEENLNIIVDETQRLSGLVNDVVDLSRYNAKADALKLEEFSITELVKNTLDHYEKMYQSYYQFSFEYSSLVTVKADQLKISQVLYNLLNNAVNYSKDSQEIRIRQDVLGNNVAISVSNYGETISEEEIPHLFERYYRSKSNHVRAQVGSGLGLSIVKGIVNMHQGKCYAESKDGLTTFTFEIPMRNAS